MTSTTLEPKTFLDFPGSVPLATAIRKPTQRDPRQSRCSRRPAQASRSFTKLFGCGDAETEPGLIFRHVAISDVAEFAGHEQDTLLKTRFHESAAQAGGETVRASQPHVHAPFRHRPAHARGRRKFLAQRRAKDVALATIGVAQQPH